MVSERLGALFICVSIIMFALGFAFHYAITYPDCEPVHYKNDLWTNRSGDVIGVAKEEDSKIVYIEGC
jgi:hypothetical protein